MFTLKAISLSAVPCWQGKNCSQDHLQKPLSSVQCAPWPCCLRKPQMLLRGNDCSHTSFSWLELWHEQCFFSLQANRPSESRALLLNQTEIWFLELLAYCTWPGWHRWCFPCQRVCFLPFQRGCCSVLLACEAERNTGAVSRAQCFNKEHVLFKYRHLRNKMSRKSWWYFGNKPPKSQSWSLFSVNIPWRLASHIWDGWMCITSHWTRK